MNSKTVDLHVHSNYSDGTLSPSQLVAYALEKQLSAFALTDHDTYDGYPEAKQAASGTSLEVIPGIEFSTTYLEKDVHIVGLDIDLNHPVLLSRMMEFQHSRDERNRSICDRMRENGFDISLEQLQKRFGNHILTRAHFGRYLWEQGYVSSIREAFTLYIGEGRPYYVPREKITPHEVVRLTYEIGGIPVLAHPMLITLPKQTLRQLIQELIPEGLMGIEGIYSTYSEEETSYVRDLAKEFGLILSGGSDFHGSNKPGLDLGSGYDEHPICVGYEILETLREARRNRHDGP